MKFGYREVENPSFEFLTSPNKDTYGKIPALLDLGFLYKLNEKTHLGLLIQGIFNFRFGLSYKFNDAILFSYESYDTFHWGTNDYEHNRIGIEYKPFDNIALRIGSESLYTWGVGYKNDRFEVDYFQRIDKITGNYYLSGFSARLNI